MITESFLKLVLSKIFRAVCYESINDIFKKMARKLLKIDPNNFSLNFKKIPFLFFNFIDYIPSFSN